MGLIKTGLKAVVAVKTADVIHERHPRAAGRSMRPARSPIQPTGETGSVG